MQKATDVNTTLVHSDRRPIGIFDSGVGGLSVWEKIRVQLPNESTLYFADQIHIPYGSRTLSEVRHYATEITRFLLNHSAKLIVVACNTASGASLHGLREQFPHIGFVGMEPAVKPAVENTSTGHIGVIATPTTFQGPLYQELVHRFGRDVTIHTQICPGLVELIEQGHTTDKTTFELLQQCLSPLLEFNIDQLVLGCTHYPFIIDAAKRVVGETITLINPAPAVARQTGRMLLSLDIRNTNMDSTHVFFTTDSIHKLTNVAQALVGYNGPIYETVWEDNALTENSVIADG